MENKELNQAAAFMDMLMEPLGECAPDRRVFVVDYTEPNGKDYHQELVAWLPKGAGTGPAVELIMDTAKSPGRRVTGIVELTGGKVKVLYYRPEKE